MKCLLGKNHVWVPKGEREVCSVCNEQFPCKVMCGHFDCIEKRGRTRCEYCNKPIIAGERFEQFAGHGGKTKAAHFECRDKMLAEERAEKERRGRIATGNVTTNDL